MKSSRHLPDIAIGQTNRKIEYRLITTIDEGPTDRIVTKKALDDSGKYHIKQIYNNCLTLKLMNLDIDVVDAHISKDEKSISFNYIDGLNTEFMLLEAVLNDRKGEALKIIEDVFSFIDSVEQANKKLVKNITYKKCDFNSKPNPETSNDTRNRICVLDCNFDNFIYSKRDKLSMIDYEWVFIGYIDPKIIKSRALVFFFQRYYDALRYKPSHKNHYILVESFTKILIPDYIYDKYEDVFSNTTMVGLQKVEQVFQEHVAGRKDTIGDAHSKTKYHHTLISQPELTLPEAHVIQGEHIATLQAQNIELDSKLHDLEEKIERIYQSKSWKYLLKVRGVKRVFYRKQK